MMKYESKKQIAQELTMLRRVVCELEKSGSDLRQIEARSRKVAQKYRVVADTAYDWEFWLSPDAQYTCSPPSFERLMAMS
jgi:hypothetical protein